MSFRASCRRQSHNGIRPCAPSLSAAPFRSAKPLFGLSFQSIPVLTVCREPHRAECRLPLPFKTCAADLHAVRLGPFPSALTAFVRPLPNGPASIKPRTEANASSQHAIFPIRRPVHADSMPITPSSDVRPDRPSLVISPAPQQRLGSYRPCSEALRTASRDRLRSTTCCS